MWSKVQRLNGAFDPKRGKLFSRQAGAGSLAAKAGGVSPGGDALLHGASQAARRDSSENPCALAAGRGERDAATGAEIFFFKQKSAVAVSTSAAIEANALGATYETCAADVTADDERHFIATAHGQLNAVGDSQRRAGLELDAIALTSITPTYLPKTTVPSRTKRQRMTPPALRGARAQ